MPCAVFSFTNNTSSKTEDYIGRSTQRTTTTIDNILADYVKNKVENVKKLAPVQVPLIFLIDNINIYCGNKKYHRLFHVIGPNMWNFTGRGILIPNISGLENILSCR